MVDGAGERKGRRGLPRGDAGDGLHSKIQPFLPGGHTAADGKLVQLFTHLARAVGRLQDGVIGVAAAMQKDHTIGRLILAKLHEGGCLLSHGAEKIIVHHIDAIIIIVCAQIIHCGFNGMYGLTIRPLAVGAILPGALPIIPQGLMLFADLVARVVIAPLEIPVGAVTALIGTPVFAYMLIRRGRDYDG